MSYETQEEGCGADIFCGGPLVIDERIEADVMAGIAELEERREIRDRLDNLPDVGDDMEDEGQRLADLLALVRPPDQTYYGGNVRQDNWNITEWNDPMVVILVSHRRGIGGIGMALAQYGTEDYTEILKRFSDPEFRAAHNLDKTPDFSAVTRDIARS